MSRTFLTITALPLLAWCATASAQRADFPAGPLPAPPAPPLAPWPAAAPGRILSTPDWSDYRIYPQAARRHNAEGVVASETLIATDGAPVECRIVQSSGSADLDAGTCELMMKMRFEPARDKEGEVIRSSFRRRVNWLLDDPRPFASSAIQAKVGFDQGGDKQCQLIAAEGAYAAVWSTVACRFLGDADYYFNSNAGAGKRFIVAVRLDAGDQSDFLTHPWPEGKLTAQEKVTFEIDKHGDPSACTAQLSWGFGKRGLNNLSPCGRLLSILWIKDALHKTGSLETRVYMLADGQ